MASSLVRMNGKLIPGKQGGCHVFSVTTANGDSLMVPVWNVPEDGFVNATSAIIGELTSKKFAYGGVETELGVEVKQLWMLPIDEKVNLSGKIFKMGKGHFCPSGHRGLDMTVKVGKSYVPVFAWHDMADIVEEEFKEGDEVEVYGSFVSQAPYGRDSRHPYVTMVKIDRIRHC